MFKTGLRLRKQLLIDHRIQLPILQRMGFYMLACAIYFMVVLFWAESTSYGHESMSRTLTLCFDVMICWAPGVMLLAPIMAYDVLVFTNKFAGPMFRLRREMQGLIEGQSSSPIKLRNDDCWPEMADLFNAIQTELMELRAATSPKTKVLFDPKNANVTDSLISDSPAPDSAAESSEPQADNPDQPATESSAVADAEIGRPEGEDPAFTGPALDETDDDQSAPKKQDSSAAAAEPQADDEPLLAAE